MCAALTSPTRERLVRICGMFGSDYEGERANAAAAADRLLREHRLTWRDVLAPCPVPRPEARQGGDHRARALAALRHADRLDDWSRRFLHSIAGWSGPLSPKQAKVLRRIEERLA